MRIGIVIPWFGRELKGGAEQQAWHLAHRLNRSGVDVEVLTTCSRSFLHSWHSDYYRDGISFEDSLLVRRFKLRKRNKSLFDHVVGRMLKLRPKDLVPGFFPLSNSDEQIYWRHNIGSPDLIDYLKTHEASYDAFIFLPYLFPLTYEGTLAVPHKAYIQPCLHDEVYAYLRGSVDMVSQCRGLLFNSQGEYSLALDLYGSWVAEKSWIVGEGVEYVRPSRRPLISGPYFLVLGRRCLEKNTHLAIEAFLRFRDVTESTFKLVLAGPEPIPISYSDPQIIDLGLVGIREKETLLRDAVALVNLSVNESFSRVLYESWLASHAVIVHKKCRATWLAVEESGGAGLGAETVAQAADAMRQVEAEWQEGSWQRRGQKGHEFAKERSDWKAVIQRYHDIFENSQKQDETQKAKRRILLVYSLPYSCQATLADFNGMQKLLDQDQLTIVSRLNAVELVESKPQDLLIWFGSDSWSEQWHQLTSQVSKKAIRCVVPPAATREFSKQFDFDFSPGQALNGSAFVPLMPLKSLQADQAAVDLFFHLEKSALKFVCLLDWQKQDSIVFGYRLFDFFSKRYDRKLELFVGCSSDDEVKRAQALEITGRIRVIAVNLNSESSRLSSYYRVADAMVVLSDPQIKPESVYVARSYFLPIALIDSPFWQTLLRRPSLSSQGGRDLAKAAAAIKFACEELERDETNSEEYSLMNFYPGALAKHLSQAIDYALTRNLS